MKIHEHDSQKMRNKKKKKTMTNFPQQSNISRKNEKITIIKKITNSSITFQTYQEKK